MEGAARLVSMKRIPLSNRKGKVVGYASVDNKDFEKVNKWKWSAQIRKDGRIYAVRSVMKKGVQTFIYLHRFLMKAEKGQLVDHRFGRTLDNRRGKLRISSSQQNSCNRKGNSNHLSSKYKGIARAKGMVTRPFRARIIMNGKRFEIGYFRTEEEGAMAYNKFAKKLHGKFARLNKII